MKVRAFTTKNLTWLLRLRRFMRQTAKFLLAALASNQGIWAVAKSYGYSNISLIFEHKENFEDVRGSYTKGYSTYGKTIAGRLYSSKCVSPKRKLETRGRRVVSIDERIEKAKKTVLKTKEKYDHTLADLKVLVDRKKAEIIVAIEVLRGCLIFRYRYTK